MRHPIHHLQVAHQTAHQTARLSGPSFRENQVQNHAGGFVFEVDLWTRLHRFLVLGSEGGTYYVSERELTLESAGVVLDALAEDPRRAVETIRSISVAGRAPSNRPALLALALAFCEPKAVPAARAAFRDVVRTGTHLFDFLTSVKSLRGFGRALRGAVADWYVKSPVDRLGYQVVKYRQRLGWTHRDALRLAHPTDAERNELFAWAAGRRAAATTSQLEALPPIVRGFAAAQVADVGAIPALVREFGLTHEMVPSEALRDEAVLRALGEVMPLGALVRFLGRLSAAGVLVAGSPVERSIVTRIQDARALHQARLHPMALLVAQRTYASGQGARGSLRWPVSQATVQALNVAFRKAFGQVEPTGQRILAAVDVSGSMSAGYCAGAPSVTCMEGALALAMVMAATERNVLIKGFSDTFVDLPVSTTDTVAEATQGLWNMPFGATDCALPMQWAQAAGEAIDAFVILTDNETWFGREHPVVALRRYRRQTGIQARLIVVAMTGTSFSIADPGDPLSLDVVGFDAATPRLVNDFIAGRL